MRIYLASFLQQENFGSGRLISITNKSKPKNIKVDNIFNPLTPSNELIKDYHSTLATEGMDKAGTFFTNTYKNQLNNFLNKVKEDCQKENKTPQELLPFKDGDTLCSWERAEHTHYRKILAPYLNELGFEVVSN